MSTKNSKSAEVIRLLSAMEAKLLTDEEFARLDSLLGSDIEARRLMIDFIALDDDLQALPVDQLESRSAEAVSANPVSPSSQRYLGAAWSFFAISAGIAACLGWLWFGIIAPAEGVAETPADPAEYIATLRAVDGAEWEGTAGEFLRSGTRLLPGEYRLAAGAAHVKFDSGASLVLRGPTVVSVLSESAASIQSGDVVFRSDGAGLRFTLTTPGSRWMHFGTEYAVRVTPSSEEVHVLEGEVHRVIEGEVTDRLYTGGAKRFSPEATDEISLLPELFTNRLDPERSPAIDDQCDESSAYESFDYDTPEALLRGDANGGIGWNGPWSIAPGQPFEQSGFALGEGKAPEGWGGHCRCESRMVALRLLREPILMDQDGLTYLSFRFRFESSPVPREGIHGEVLLVLRDLPARDTPFFKDGLRFRAHHEYAIVSRRNDFARIEHSLKTGQDYLFVAKIVRGAERPDQLLARVFEAGTAPDSEEPASWSLVSPSFDSDEHLERLTLHLHTDTHVELVDDIRFGPSWASIRAPLVHPSGAPPSQQP